MNIFICTSKHLYHKIPSIKEQLERAKHKITLPNSYEDPMKEERVKALSREEHIKLKKEFLRLQEKKIINNDAILVLNFEKNGHENYIGGATFLEIFKAWELGKKIFLFNPIPKNIFEDELIGINPIIINGNLDLIE